MRCIIISIILYVLIAGCEGCSVGAGNAAGSVRVSSIKPAEPLLQQSNMEYQGAFRLPRGRHGISPQVYDSFAYGGTALAYNPANDSLFVVGHDWEQRVAEIRIPKIVNNTQLDKLSVAGVIQGVHDITEGRMANILAGESFFPGTVKIGGLLVYNGKLVGTSYAYFDGAGQAALSHFISSPNLSATGDFQGMFKVGLNIGAGFVDGYMALIPKAWQAFFGGPALTGNAALGVVSRTSYGPSSFVFDPDELGRENPVPAAAVVYYPQKHATLGDWGSTNPYFNGTTQIRGLVFPAGWRSVLFFGRHGTGKFCYGAGIGEAALATTSGQCYDPADSSKGTHGYPYVYQVWAYDALDLLAVKNGEKKPWGIKPYAIWQFNLPFGKSNAIINGAAYDPQGRRIFISAAYGDNDGMPLIHVFELKEERK